MFLLSCMKPYYKITHTFIGFIILFMNTTQIYFFKFLVKEIVVYVDK